MPELVAVHEVFAMRTMLVDYGGRKGEKLDLPCGGSCQVFISPMKAVLSTGAVGNDIASSEP